MNWIDLTDDSQLDEIKLLSNTQPQVIFKHSTRCSISRMAKSRLERETEPDGVQFHLLNLLKYRSLSNRIANEFNVEHESPQVLIIRDGVCVFDESHSAIDMEDIIEHSH